VADALNRVVNRGFDALRRLTGDGYDNISVGAFVSLRLPANQTSEQIE
jgi:hypothetical protein